MTKEQEVIENLTDLLKQRNEKQVQITTYDLFENIETVLNMLKEKDNIIKGKQSVIETQAENEEVLLNTLKKKDKQINLMARAFKQDDVRTVEEIKQYFERKSEE